MFRQRSLWRFVALTLAGLVALAICWPLSAEVCRQWLSLLVDRVCPLMWPDNPIAAFPNPCESCERGAPCGSDVGMRVFIEASQGLDVRVGAFHLCFHPAGLFLVLVWATPATLIRRLLATAVGFLVLQLVTLFRLYLGILGAMAWHVSSNCSDVESHRQFLQAGSFQAFAAKAWTVALGESGLHLLIPILLWIAFVVRRTTLQAFLASR